MRKQQTGLNFPALAAALRDWRADPTPRQDLTFALVRLASSILREAALERGGRLSDADVENLLGLWMRDGRAMTTDWRRLRRDYALALDVRMLGGAGQTARPSHLFAQVLAHSPPRDEGRTLSRRVRRWGLKPDLDWAAQPASAKRRVIRGASEELEVLLDGYLATVAPPAAGGVVRWG